MTYRTSSSGPVDTELVFPKEREGRTNYMYNIWGNNGGAFSRFIGSYKAWGPRRSINPKHRKYD